MPADAIAAILTSVCQVEAAPAETARRADLPLRRLYKGASFEAALTSASLAHRKRTLEDIEENLLARSSRRQAESRVQAWQRLCNAWPMSSDSLKRVAASLRQGGYSSIQEYMNAAMWYQEQQLRMPIGLGAGEHRMPFDMILATRFMMREAELANARVGDVRLEGANVSILLFVQKVAS